MMAFPTNGTTNQSSSTPYLACLLPDVSMEIQEKLRNITNSVFLPISLALAVLSFLSNCLLLVAVARMKARLHPSMVLLCSLSVSDLMWAAVCLYRGTRVAIHVHRCPPSGDGEIYLSILCIFLTLSNLAVISKDRHRAVSKPRWYLNHMTKTRALKEAFISWLSSVTTVLVVYVVVIFLPVKVIFIKNIIALAFCIGCIVTIVASYIGIFVASKRHQLKSMPQDGARRSLAALNREKKLAVTVGLILLSLIFTLLPALVSPVVLTVMGYKSKAPFRSFITIFINLYGLLNPAINCGKNEAIQRSVRRLLGCQFLMRQDRNAAVGDAHHLSKQSTRSTKETIGATSHECPEPKKN